MTAAILGRRHRESCVPVFGYEDFIGALFTRNALELGIQQLSVNDQGGEIYIVRTVGIYSRARLGSHRRAWWVGWARSPSHASSCWRGRRWRTGSGSG